METHGQQGIIGYDFPPPGFYIYQHIHSSVKPQQPISKYNIIERAGARIPWSISICKSVIDSFEKVILKLLDGVFPSIRAMASSAPVVEALPQGASVFFYILHRLLGFCVSKMIIFSRKNYRARRKPRMLLPLPDELMHRSATRQPLATRNKKIENWRWVCVLGKPEKEPRHSQKGWKSFWQIREPFMVIHVKRKTY